MQVRVDLTPESVKRVTLWALGAVAAAWLVVQLWPVAVLVVTALIVVGTLNPLVKRLERRGLRHRTALALVVLSVVGVGLVIGIITIPKLVDQILAAAREAPGMQAHLASLLRKRAFTSGWASAVERFNAADLVQASKAFEYTRFVVELVGALVTILMLAIYLIADRDRLGGALFAVVPRDYHVRLARILINLEMIVGGYVRGQLITSGAMGVVVFVLLTAMRVDGALALAVFAGLTDVIPYIGVLLAITPAVLATLSHGTGHAIVVAVVLVAYQEFESRILVPRIYGKVLRLPSAAVVVALLIGGKLLGMMGALLALPVAAGLRMLVHELRVELPGAPLADDVQDEDHAPNH
jgi:predicted PurR-regulated permease PerM